MIVPIIEVAANEKRINKVNFKEEKNLTITFFCIEL
jgi:hypothetical protein